MAYDKYINYTSEDLILPYEKFPSIQQIEKIQPVEKINPYTAYQGLNAKRAALNRAKQNKQTKTFLSNYNDPTELNSFIDALTNREAVSKKFGDAWGTISTISGTASMAAFAGSIIAAALAPFTGGASLAVAAPLAKVGAITAIPAIPAATDVTIEKGIKPILKNKPKEAGLNMLMNVGETMDFMANPVKGLFIEGPEGFIKGTGLAEGGRVNYDYDTGFFLTDMLLETISDPMNWVDFGTSMALKSTTKTVGKEATEQIVNQMVDVTNKQFAKQITAEGAERISEQVAKTTSQVAREWAEKNFNKLTKAEADKLLSEGRNKIQQSLVRAIRKEIPEASSSEISLILKETSKTQYNKQLVKTAYEQIQDITFDTLSNDVIKGLSGVQHYSKNMQKFMTKNAFMTSGYGVGIELVKKGFKPVREWANKTILRKLKEAKLFSDRTGINIKDWDKAKSFWDASGQYTSAITGEVTIRDLDTFYQCAQQQFTRDQEQIRTIIKMYPNDAIKQANALDNIFNGLYGCNFQEYIGFLKGINDAENGKFKVFAEYAEQFSNFIEQGAFNQRTGVKLTTVSNLYSAKNIDELLTNNIEDLAKIKLDIDKNTLVKNFTNKLYTIKIANDQVNAILLQNENITKVMTKLNNAEEIGSLFKAIIDDVNAHKPLVAAEITDRIDIIQKTAKSFKNIQDLYTNVAENLVLPKIKGVTDEQFRQYLINEIFGSGLYKSTTELLAGFGNALKDIQYGIELIAEDVKFNFNDYPGLSDQISQVYYDFLNAQKAAGVEDLTMTIDENFTKYIDDLIKDFPDYNDDLFELASANKDIGIILSAVKQSNEALLQEYISNNSIFNAARRRQLVDMGLALRTIGRQEDFALFNIPEDVSNINLNGVGQLGRNINDMKKKLNQYSFKFTDKYAEKVNSAYHKFYTEIVTKSDTDVPLTAFKYLKETNDTIEQFAQMSQFKQMVNDNVTARGKFNILINDKAFQYDLGHPEVLLTTEFAMNPMQLSETIAKKKLQEDIINLITQYKNLGIQSKKITNDFQELRKLLSESSFDMPKRLQMERYIKKCSNINDFLTDFSEYFDTLFDRGIAEEHIENLRNVLINFPELEQRYSGLIDRLEQYWNGDLKFEQSAKYAEKQIDEFTPFWEEIKTMNTDIQETISKHNKDVTIGAITEGQQFSYKNVTPWDPVKKQQELNKAINRATNENAKVAIYDVLSLTPEEFKNELAFRHRFITFSDNDLNSNMRAMLYKLSGKDAIFEDLTDTLKMITTKEKDIHFIYDTQAHRHWIILDKNIKVNANGRQYFLNDNKINRVIKKKQFNEFIVVDDLMQDFKGKKFSETLNELDDTVELLTGSRLGASQGEYLDANMLKKIHKQMPEEVQKLLDIDTITDKQFFDTYLFNESILGSITSKTDLGIYNGSMLTNLANTMTQTQSYLKPKVEYVNTIFDSSFSIGNPQSIYSGFSDQELLEALQANTDYKLIALTDDKKYGMQVREIYPTSIEAIQKGKELGAVIVPLQTYKDMYNTVNHRIGSSGAAKLWSRIMYAYKFGYLARPGAMIRNWIDTNLKTALNTDGEFASYKAQAHKILNEYDEIKDFVMKRKQYNIEHLIEEESLSNMYKAYFGQLDVFDEAGNIIGKTPNLAKTLTYEQFLELNDQYFSQGVAENVMASLYKTEQGDMWRTVTEMSGKVIDEGRLPLEKNAITGEWTGPKILPGNQTERYNRLAIYLQSLDSGLDNTGALARLSKIHFDYSFKTKAEQLVDMVFPFTTFSMRNYSFWIEMLEKHPWLMRNYVHLMKPSWDFKDYTPQELARDRQLQSQIINGHLKLAEFENKRITFKMNPSIQNAMQMFSDPINAVYERLAAPISTPIELLQGNQPTISSLSNLIPVAGPSIQSVNTMIKTKSPMPSAISVSQKTASGKFKNKNLSGINGFKDKQYRRPNYQKNVVYDSYKTKGITRYRTNLYPIVNIAQDIKNRYSVNVYNRVKNRVKTDVFRGIQYRIRLDANRFR